MDNRLLQISFKDALSALADLLMPRVCLVCGRPLTLRERFMCLPCSFDLPLTHYERWEHNPMADKYNLRIEECRRCPQEWETSSENGVFLQEMSQKMGHLRQSEEKYEPYQRAAALFFYRRGSGYDNITQELKYHANFAAGRYFAAMLGRRLRESPLFVDVDLVVPVPLHWTRRARRGYNQAEIVAGEVARVLSIPLAPRLLRRVRRTRTQTRTADRFANISGAFAVRSVHTWSDLRPGMCKKGQKRSYLASFFARYARRTVFDANQVRHILLIDDVFTTGATLTACHEALRQVFGPEVRISVATLAFAE